MACLPIGKKIRNIFERNEKFLIQTHKQRTTG